MSTRKHLTQVSLKLSRYKVLMAQFPFACFAASIDHLVNARPTANQDAWKHMDIIMCRSKRRHWKAWPYDCKFDPSRRKHSYEMWIHPTGSIYQNRYTKNHQVRWHANNLGLPWIDSLRCNSKHFLVILGLLMESNHWGIAKS